MTSSIRGEMISVAQLLLSTEGTDGTTFATVLAASGAPRGSVYHHFPQGRPQLIEEAARAVGDRVTSQMMSITAVNPGQVVQDFAAPWRALLTGSGFAAGCAVAAVAANYPTTTEKIFAAWIDALSTAFETSGMRSAAARSTATTVISAVEGAILLARSSSSLDEFDSVIDDLADLAALRVSQQ